MAEGITYRGSSYLGQPSLEEPDLPEWGMELESTLVMTGQERNVLIRVLLKQAREAQKDALRMKRKGLAPNYDQGVRDGLMIALRALRRGRA